jgi:hypothetical protein
MKQLYRNHYLNVLILCVIALGLFLALTNPSNISVGWLVIPVIMLFFIAFCAAQIILTGMRLIRGNSRKRRIVALVSASLLTIVMILQSTGGIAGVDMLLLGLIILVSAIYISKF